MAVLTRDLFIQNTLRASIKPYIYSFFAFVAGFVAALIVVLSASKSPLSAAITFFGGPISSWFYLGKFLNSASLFLFCGLGSVMSLISGNLNLGGEGQIYLGGFITALLINKLTGLPPIVAILITGIIAGLASGLMALISGLFKVVKGSSVLLTTFLLSSGSIPIFDAAISGPFRDQSGNLLATPTLPESFRLPSFVSSGTSIIIFLIAIPLCIFFGYLIYITQKGAIIRITGKAPLFAKYAGYNTNLLDCLGLFISGFLHGLTGFFAVCGVYYTCYSGFASGMGWNALTVALIAKANPVAVIPASLAFSYLLTACDCVVLENNFGFDLASLIQAVVLVCISASVTIIPDIARGFTKRKNSQNVRPRSHSSWQKRRNRL